MNRNTCSGLAAVCALFFGLVGCSGEATHGNAEMADALSVLKEGLDAWKAGGTPASLEAAAKPLQFTDADWKAGAKLTEYTVVKVGEDDGETAYTVSLKLDVRGKATDKTVNYRVSLTPKRTVARTSPR